MIKLYDFTLSGNAHRIRLLLSLLQLPHQRIEIDLAAGEQKQDWFLHLNPLGEVPVLVDDDVVLRDSTAILVYLAKKYDGGKYWLPEDAKLAAEIQQWLAIAGHEMNDGPSNARRVTVFGRKLDHAQAIENSHQLFRNVFEPQLAQQNWLVGDHPTIADIANYSYIKVAPEGGVNLDEYPHIRSWLARIEALENFATMPKAKPALA